MQYVVILLLRLLHLSKLSALFIAADSLTTTLWQLMIKIIICMFDTKELKVYTNYIVGIHAIQHGILTIIRFFFAHFWGLSFTTEQVEDVKAFLIRILGLLLTLRPLFINQLSWASLHLAYIRLEPIMLIKLPIILFFCSQYFSQLFL